MSRVRENRTPGCVSWKWRNDDVEVRQLETRCGLGPDRESVEVDPLEAGVDLGHGLHAMNYPGGYAQGNER